MTTPEFILRLREHVGHDQLWIAGSSVFVLRDHPERPGVRQTLLALRADNGHWCPLGGINDPGEDAAVTMVREAREEAGIDIEVDRLLWHWAMAPHTFPNGDTCLFLSNTLVARWVGGEAHVADDENSDMRWFDEDALPGMPPDFEIGWRLLQLERRETVLGYAGARALLGADVVDALLAAERSSGKGATNPAVSAL